MSKEAIEQIKSLLGPKGWSEDEEKLAPRLVEERGLFKGSSPLLAMPANTDEVSGVMKIAFAANISVVPQGGNTGLVGGGVPSDGEIIISLERMNRIEDVNPIDMSMTVEAGCILANVQAAAADAGAYFPLSLGSEGSCQIGGNLSTNAGGVQVFRYGNARELALGLEVVMADGRIWNGLQSLRKDNSGYDLKQLFIGSEGTLGVITRATLRLFPAPNAYATALAGCTSYEDALKLFLHARANIGEQLSAVEVMDSFAIELAVRHIPNCHDPFNEKQNVYVLLEATSTNPNAALGDLMEKVLSEAMDNGLAVDVVIAQSESQREGLWRLRDGIPEAQKKEGGSIKHDISVPISKVPEFISRATELVKKEIPGVRPVPFGHLGDGNIHFNLTQPENADKQEYLSNWGRINALVHDLAINMGGSFSAEHGIGLLKVGDMNNFKRGDGVALMTQLKKALDPKNTLNPGKVLDSPGAGLAKNGAGLDRPEAGLNLPGAGPAKND
ncbi:MAG: FAD-binding oxidoreductase [Rhodospirillaceae bacterium]|nr:FAD-binding oxidoreductase [Rhodospirillaceae bacterium]